MYLCVFLDYILVIFHKLHWPPLPPPPPTWGVQGNAAASEGGRKLQGMVAVQHIFGEERRLPESVHN